MSCQIGHNWHCHSHTLVKPWIIYTTDILLNVHIGHAQVTENLSCVFLDYNEIDRIIHFVQLNFIKAALINIFILTVDQITTYNVIVLLVVMNPESSSVNLQSFRSRFGFMSHNFAFLVCSHRSHQRSFQMQHAAFSAELPDKPTWPAPNSWETELSTSW